MKLLDSLVVRRGEWATFAVLRSKLNFTELDCINGQYSSSTGANAPATPAVERGQIATCCV